MVFFGFVCYGRFHLLYQFPSVIEKMCIRDRYLGEEVTEAVISVPAYFNEVKRKAVKQAGELAGLKVERIISEPTAAAIAYGLYQKNDNTRFLVFDLGGGTFDVSILELFDDILEVRAVAGDNYLGGEDFTNLIVEEFYKEHGQMCIRDRCGRDRGSRHFTFGTGKVLCVYVWSEAGIREDRGTNYILSFRN